MAKSSGVFVHKYIYNARKCKCNNARKNSVKRELKTKKKQTKQNEKIPKTFVAVFTEYEFD